MIHPAEIMLQSDHQIAKIARDRLTAKGKNPAEDVDEAPIELTDRAIANSMRLPRPGIHKVTVLRARKIVRDDGRTFAAVTLQAENGLIFDDLQTVRTPYRSKLVQQGLQRLRTYVDIADANPNLKDFDECLESLRGAQARVNIEHYTNNDDVNCCKVISVKPITICS